MESAAHGSFGRVVSRNDGRGITLLRRRTVAFNASPYAGQRWYKG